MEELVTVMQQVLEELQEMNAKLSDTNEKLDEMTSAVKDVKGTGIYSMDDLYKAMGDVESAVSSAVDSIKGDGLFDTLADLYNVLNSIDENTMNIP